MKLIYRSTFVMLVLTSLFIAGCGSDQKQESPAHDDVETSMKTPDTYAAAIEQCEFHLAEIAELIEKGKLSEVHREAAKIRDIARKLPQLAKGSVPVEMLKDINIKSKELAGMFTEVDKAADSGDEAGTIRAHQKMQTLVDALKLHISQNEKQEN